jgi:hypothetical protein
MKLINKSLKSGFAEHSFINVSQLNRNGGSLKLEGIINLLYG